MDMIDVVRSQSILYSRYMRPQLWTLWLFLSEIRYQFRKLTAISATITDIFPISLYYIIFFI